ncbi:MAG: glycoside hydrolase family 3 protein [Erysipelotrichaceae bacterium]|nr:MAG: glycoside hydrolase family 3 protein [Erysipelotrichaceae bacterium]
MATSIQKAKRLLTKMTLDEKIGQMVQFGRIKLNEKNLVREGKIGSFLNSRNVALVNEVQRIAMEQSRLKIPLLIGSDIIHGYVSTFPIPVAEACSWNLDLIESSAKHAMTEAAADGIRWNFAPMVDIARDPRWGRIAEGAGEDPYLGAQIAKARVRGFQAKGKNGYPLAAACAKHFVAYGGAEGGRDYNTVDMSEHVLRTTYLPPFKAAVDEGVMSFMSSFNDILSVPSSANDFSLRQVLKGEWRFDGFVVSDWESIEEVIAHGIADDRTSSALAGLKSGVDMDMHSGVYHDHLKELVIKDKKLELLIDDSVLRILKIKYDLGLFEHPYTDPNLRDEVILNKETVEMTLKMARESIVLLKNEALLPLSKEQKIALIGPFGDDPHTPIGCWGAEGNHKNTVTVKMAFENAGLDFVIAQGCDSIDPKVEWIQEAVDLASHQDIIILTLGERQDMSGENNNRAFLDLPGAQLELLRALKKLNKPIITLLFNGRPMTIPETVEKSDALLAVGKLVTTFPKTVGQIPLYYNHKRTGRPKFRRYIDCDEEPLFHFGFGLSYSNFIYDKLIMKKSRLGKKDKLEFTIDVYNDSDIDGQEIVQVYYRDLLAQVTRPVKELCAFEKANFKAHQLKTLSFSIPISQFGYYDPEMNFIIEKGNFALWVGPSSIEGIASEFTIR